VTDFKLDMTMMLAIHDAFRRDLEQLAQMRTRTEGWELFERMLHIHHHAEDELLWPVAREAVRGRSDDLAVFDDMSTEHHAFRPLLADLNRSLDRGESPSDAEVQLDARLREHIAHEEAAALPLIDRTLTEEQWMAFGQGSAEMVGADMPRFLPWLLEGADENTTARVLSVLPEPVQQTYRNEWRPAFDTLHRWAAKSAAA
jgi:iron-sulfur cluster repair protein YtfE (RIC family)